MTGYGPPSDLLQPSAAIVEESLPTLAEVCELPDEFLGRLDVGVLNLMCAAGLPGAEDLDIVKALAWLDEAARQVDLHTRSHLDEFAHNPALYDYSPGKFCCEYLLRTLQELLGVRYNPARAADSEFQNALCTHADFRNAHDLFIHGMMGGPGGICASMPVMYVAVARRVGYPLELVEAPAHMFSRWVDPEGRRFNVPEVFNVEGTGRGISFHPDEYYRTWPRDWTRAEKAADWYLNCLSPAGELAAFLATRGSCLEGNGRMEEALQAFKWATQLVPDDLRYKGKLCSLLNQCYEAGLQAIEVQRQALDVEKMMFEQRVHRLESLAAQANCLSHGGSCQCLHCTQTPQAIR